MSAPGWHLIVPKPGRPSLQPFPMTAHQRSLGVKTAWTIVSPGTERAFALGLPNTPRKFPYRPGYCASGWQKQGNRKVLLAHGGEHSSYWPRVAQEGDKGWFCAVPAGVTPYAAAFTNLGHVALQAVQEGEAALAGAGNKVVVIGVGLVGMMIQKVLAARGINPILSARVTIRVKAGNRKPETMVSYAPPKELPMPPGTVIFEAAGTASGVTLALDLAPHGGTVVLAGSPRETVPIDVYGTIFKKRLTVIGAHAMGVPQEQKQRQREMFLDLLARGKVKLDDLDIERVHWRQAVPAYRKMLARKGKRHGLAIRWS